MQHLGMYTRFHAARCVEFKFKDTTPAAKTMSVGVLEDTALTVTLPSVDSSTSGRVGARIFLSSWQSRIGIHQKPNTDSTSATACAPSVGILSFFIDRNHNKAGDQTIENVYDVDTTKATTGPLRLLDVTKRYHVLSTKFLIVNPFDMEYTGTTWSAFYPAVTVDFYKSFRRALPIVFGSTTTTGAVTDVEENMPCVAYYQVYSSTTIKTAVSNAEVEYRHRLRYTD